MVMCESAGTCSRGEKNFQPKHKSLTTAPSVERKTLDPYEQVKIQRVPFLLWKRELCMMEATRDDKMIESEVPAAWIRVRSLNFQHETLERTQGCNKRVFSTASLSEQYTSCMIASCVVMHGLFFVLRTPDAQKYTCANKRQGRTKDHWIRAREIGIN